MNLLTLLLRSSWQRVAIAVLAGFLSGMSSAGLIALISRGVGGGLGTTATTLAWVFVGLAAIALITSITTRVVLIRLCQDAIFQLQIHLSRQILASELRHLEQLGNARLLATLTEDVQAVSNAVFLLPFMFINGAIVFGCLIYICWLSWSVVLVALGLMVLGLGSSRVLLKRGRAMLALAREDQDSLFQGFRAITDGIKELKLHYHRRQAFLSQELQVAADRFRRHTIAGLNVYAYTESYGKLLFFVAIGLVVFLLPALWAVPTPTIAGFVIAFTYMFGPLDNIVAKMPQITKATVSLRKIQALGLSLRDRAESLTVPAEVQAWDKLQLQGVVHTYHSGQEDKEFSLGPINLQFQPGELVFIVGGNGSGKSTLAKLITGLYTPESGQIWLDQHLITDQNREWYRQHFSTIFADFYLFEQLLGIDRPELDQQVQRYLQQLQLDRKVSIQAGRLSTTALSQGQRKRLALLTSYLDDRPIYLFDEWAADQDPSFKALFYSELLPNLRDRGKTILVITHDDHYFHLADRVIKMEYGQIEYDTGLGE